ncbi:hypothetical protein KC722_02860 [Candidatus Kaiserbacteria bacterium]|nr:hypothetical protein [Candidatus Kaiserbacteria bacterium]MCB9811377.1 hypothetical protein [Candidatus Nomurabacteria bacterium]
MPYLTLGRMLTGAVILAVLGITGSTILKEEHHESGMFLEPAGGTYGAGEQFEVRIMVRSSVPANVFGGDITFDPDVLAIDGIDYNTSVADLWAVRPWFDNGDGTLNFGGGTTAAGGFTGEAELLRITFRTKALGDANIMLVKPVILKHDGLGTSLSVDTPIDYIFTVEADSVERLKVAESHDQQGVVHVMAERPDPDLNGDGTVDFKDVSVMMVLITTQELRGDLDGNGKVGLGDLSILLDADD